MIEYSVFVDLQCGDQIRSHNFRSIEALAIFLERVGQHKLPMGVRPFAADVIYTNEIDKSIAACVDSIPKVPEAT